MSKPASSKSYFCSSFPCRFAFDGGMSGCTRFKSLAGWFSSSPFLSLAGSLFMRGEIRGFSFVLSSFEDKEGKKPATDSCLSSPPCSSRNLFFFRGSDTDKKMGWEEEEEAMYKSTYPAPFHKLFFPLLTLDDLCLAKNAALLLSCFPPYVCFFFACH